ncbi:LytR/AlgR family response regulator transcription factor [Enterococcus faecalis]
MMTNTTIYVVEDEVLYASFLVRALKEYAKNQAFQQIEPKIIQNYTQFYEKPDSIAVKDGDIFIIDIHLNTYFNGIDLAQKIRESGKEVAIIYLTSDASSSVHTINRQTFPNGYVVKQPDNQEHVKNTLFDVLQQMQATFLYKFDQGNLVLFKVGRQNLILNTNEIYYVASVNNVQNKIYIQTINNTYICSERLKQAKEKLSKSPIFFTNTKSFIVNTQLIQSVNRIDGTIYFKNNIDLYVGSKVIDKLKKYLQLL